MEEFIFKNSTDVLGCSLYVSCYPTSTAAARDVGKDSEFGPFMDFTDDDALLKDDEDDLDFTGKILETAAKNKKVQKSEGESHC